jgi:hypothetical protein
VYGFLEVVAKTGRAETNSSPGCAHAQDRPWENTHKLLSDSMKERMAPYRSHISGEPHEWRGSFEECRYKARIISRENIDKDLSRTTAKVTLDISNTGVTFAPGDRLAIMPSNSWSDIEKIVIVLGLSDLMNELVPLDNAVWKRYSQHLINIHREETAGNLSVRDILSKGKLAPLTRQMVLKVCSLMVFSDFQVHRTIQCLSPTVMKVFGSEAWPVQSSLGDLLTAAKPEVPDCVWSQAFSRCDLSWLPRLLTIEVPRTYNISTFSRVPLPNAVDVTVTRSQHEVSKVLQPKCGSRAGVSSGFLNPNPYMGQTHNGEEVNLNQLR